MENKFTEVDTQCYLRDSPTPVVFLSERHILNGVDKGKHHGIYNLLFNCSENQSCFSVWGCVGGCVCVSMSVCKEGKIET